MKIFTKTTCLFLSLLLTAGTSPAQSVSFHYTVKMEHPETHQFQVTLETSGLANTITDFKMPVWMPGYYQLLDYAAMAGNFTATGSKGQQLRWEKTNATTWRVAHEPGQSFRINYTVTAGKSFVAQPFLDSSHAYISPAGVFMYADQYLQHPVTLTIIPDNNWPSIATGLDKTAKDARTFYASDFDILYDSPLLIGRLDSIPSFTVGGIPHYFTGWRMGNFDKAALSGDLQKLVKAGSDIIGDIPYQHYTFIAIGPGRGGIEHLNSTTISFTGDGLRTRQGREQLLSFIAHEYFHHYNVKRIRPVALGPFDYSQANNTNMLWVSEGLTVYYEYLMLRRAGLMSAESLLSDLRSNIAAYENRTGHLQQSLTQASAHTWLDGPFGNSPDSTISYYQKGPAMGMLLDFAIRNATTNKKSLDDVMRTLYRVYYKEQKRGFTDAEFQQVCESVAGIPLPEFFEYISTVTPPDYNKYLGYAGLQIDMMPGEQAHGIAQKSCTISPVAQPTTLQLAIRKSWLGE